MNERIQELEKQSYTEFMHERGGRYMAFDKQKFAELIVKECASKVDWILADGGKTQGDLIKQHFGVEDQHTTTTTTNIMAGAEIHSGDDGVGYSIGTQEKYEEFVKKRNGN